MIDTTNEKVEEHETELQNSTEWERLKADFRPLSKRSKRKRSSLDKQIKDLKRYKRMVGQSLAIVFIVSVGIAFPLTIFLYRMSTLDYFSSFIATLCVVFFINITMQQLVIRKIKKLIHEKEKLDKWGENFRYH